MRFYFTTGPKHGTVKMLCFCNEKHDPPVGKRSGNNTIRHGKPAADGKDVITMEQSEKTLDMIVNLCKNRGYVFPGSEIYGGLANSWDYGPLGVEFKNNVKKAWLKKFVQESPYNVGLDAAIIMNPQTWVTTGHVSSFSDPLLDCRACTINAGMKYHK